MIMARRTRLLGWFGLGAMAAQLLAAPSSAASPAALEYQVKATFLYNFTKFVQWPSDSLASSGEPFEVGVVGSNPFGSYLAESMEGQYVHGRPVRVVEFRGPSDVRPCAIIFVPDAAGDRLADIAARIKGSPVLLIGESPGFAERGGAINFILVQNKVRFEINPAVARTAGLQISAKLLAIATVVGDDKKAD